MIGANTMVLKSDQNRLRSLVVEAVSMLLKNGLNFKSEFSIEGLLGVTLDNDDIFLININETITTGHEKLVTSPVDPKDLVTTCEVTSQPTLTSCGLTDAHLLDASIAKLVASEAGRYVITSGKDSIDTGRSIVTTEKNSVDAFQLNCLDMTIGNYNKLATELDILFESTPSVKKKDGMTDDSTHTLSLNNVEFEQLINENRKEDSASGKMAVEEDVASQASDVILVKEEGRLVAIDLQEQHNSAAEAKQDVVAMTTGSGAEAMLLSLKGDDQLPGCSVWENLEDMPLNLSDPHEPQDLSTNQGKQESGRLSCTICGKRFKSETSLLKHKEKEHTEEMMMVDMPQALNLIKHSQPLDLTTGRAESGEDTVVELDAELAAIGDQESFTCICSKVLGDYETYIDHVATCNKSRLTPYKACDICGKFFFSNSGYVKHKRLHVGAYKFRCSVCHKGFFDRTHMAAHVDSSHSKVRRYECQFCNKSFFWKHHLKRHRGTCDKAKATQDTGAGGASSVEQSATGEVEEMDAQKALDALTSTDIVETKSDEAFVAFETNVEITNVDEVF